MYNNPYFQGFDKQPITQNFQLANTLPNDMFMAKFLKENEQAENQFITTKTAFIDLFQNELTIKDTTGDVKKYQIIPPLDEKDIKINKLEQEIKQLKEMISNESNVNNSATNEIPKSDTNVE